MLGQLGHFWAVVLFVSALFASLAYFLSVFNSPETQLWKNTARFFFVLHSVAVAAVVATLFIIIYGNHYEYHYAWAHAARDLAAGYKLSCFWEGQEGSFLLWIFWNMITGLALIIFNRAWEGPAMAIYALVQAFLGSMILGVDLGITSIGSSPFVLMRDAMGHLPVYSINPDFVPEDGTGLNPLLQNYWMVIHPPTLFLGFALTLAPFSFAIAGLWLKKYREWIRPALPWTLVGAAILGLGILMGGIWAYETLNFGGYWNWDPVENAVYVPWLIMIANIHLMVSYRESGRALKSSLISAVLAFLLILYSTFLTRSGILGESSVHSFTDLGLSGQLLVYLLSFTAIATYLFAIRWAKIPGKAGDASPFSREFWIFSGSMVITLAGFQVLVPTSMPVFNALLKAVGIDSNLAPPADQIEFYTKWQLWFAAAIALMSGIAQFLWWQKSDFKSWLRSMYVPISLTLFVASPLIVLGKIDNIALIILFTTSLFSVVAGLWVAIQFFSTQKWKLTGGAITHFGMGVMFIGILFSAGYSKVLSLNTTGRIYNTDFNQELNRDHLLLWRNKPQKMGRFNVTYHEALVEPFNGNYLVPVDLLWRLDEKKGIAKSDFVHKNKKVIAKGDTVRIRPENTYYRITFEDDKGRSFELLPRAQINPEMGGLLASPDIKKWWFSDLYTHISSIPEPNAEKNWSPEIEVNTHPGDTFMINDYYARFDSLIQVKEIDGLPVAPTDFAVRAKVVIFGNNRDYIAYPTLVVRDQMLGRVPEVIGALGLRLNLNNIDPKTETITFGHSATEPDWVIIKAMEKPMINLLWAGGVVMLLGFAIAAYRRYSEFISARNRKMEF